MTLFASIARFLFSKWGAFSVLLVALYVCNSGLPFGLFKGRTDWMRIAGDRQTQIDQKNAALLNASTALIIAKQHLTAAGQIIRDVVSRANTATAALKAESDRRTAEAVAARQAADAARQRWDAIADRERALARSTPINLTAEQRIAALEASNRVFLEEVGE
jgi:hypothetical protein